MEMFNLNLLWKTVSIQEVSESDRNVMAPHVVAVAESCICCRSIFTFTIAVRMYNGGCTSEDFEGTMRTDTFAS